MNSSTPKPKASEQITATPLHIFSRKLRTSLSLIPFLKIMPSSIRLLLISALAISLTPFSPAEEPHSDIAPPDQKAALTEVILLPTMHRRHLRDKFYTLKRLESIMHAIKPDFVCSEITPNSLKNFDQGKKDSRLSLFPEFTQVILPLRKKLNYEVIPCSAWTKEVNFQTVGIQAMDKAHSALILKTLDRLQGQGKRILVTYGGGHIDGISNNLRSRKDIKITDYRPTLNKLRKEQNTEK